MSTIQIQCLQDYFIPFESINSIWKADKRFPVQIIQRFITLNKKALSFLGINAIFEEVNYNKGILFTTSNFIGAAPLRSPLLGHYYTDINVTPRFGEDISELANKLQGILEPDYLDLALFNPSFLRYPTYFDCINYFNSFSKAINKPWNKFDSVTKIETHPCSSTNWSRYAQRSVYPNQTLMFDNKKNILSRNHKEWEKLTYILYIAINEFESYKTPISIKLQYFSIISVLKRYLLDHPYSPTSEYFIVHPNETGEIKKLKEDANKLLKRNTENNKSWRIDSAELFEKYVQYVLKRVSETIGARIISNQKFSILGHRPTWALRHLEPDVIIQKNETFCFADAKYKPHMLNAGSSSDVLKDSFRTDLHQLLAYCSFDPTKDKLGMLIYPSNEFKKIKLEAMNHLGSVCNEVLLVGLPFSIGEIESNVKHLSEAFSNANRISKKYNNID